MGKGIYAPNTVQTENISESCSVPSGIKWFPQAACNNDWKDEITHQDQGNIIPAKYFVNNKIFLNKYDLVEILLSLKLTNWVRLNVTHVDLRTKLSHIRMFLAHQPAHMWEEKAARRVMRIGICIGEFVMNSMITCPFDNILIFENEMKSKIK